MWNCRILPNPDKLILFIRGGCKRAAYRACVFTEYPELVFSFVAAILFASAIILRCRPKGAPGRWFSIPLFCASAFSIYARFVMYSGLDVSRPTIAATDLLALKNQLIIYEVTTGSFPTTEQGLDVLVNKPGTPPIPGNWQKLLDSVPLDPWGSRYLYRRPTVLGILEIELCSLGKDRFESDDDIKLTWETQPHGGSPE